MHTPTCFVHSNLPFYSSCFFILETVYFIFITIKITITGSEFYFKHIRLAPLFTVHLFY